VDVKTRFGRADALVSEATADYHDRSRTDQWFGGKTASPT
jgi:hypothetical protein